MNIGSSGGDWLLLWPEARGLVLRPAACMRLHNLGQVAYVKYEETR
jgi:hypothetical protein